MDLSRFHFLPKGTPPPQGSIAVDGLIEGAALHLSHWRGHSTPVELQADTATASALAFAGAGWGPVWEHAPVVNNHYDTDGVLAAFTVMQPHTALEHRALLMAAATAGDFDEWPDDDRGLKLDAALRTLGQAGRNEADSYARVLPQVHELLERIDEREDLWGDSWARVMDGCDAVHDGRVDVSTLGRIGIIRHAPDVPELPGPVFARLLLPRCWRYLLVFLEEGDQRHFRYELPRYAWADTVVRPTLAAPDPRAVAHALGPRWTAKDLPGLTSVVGTRAAVQLAPYEVLGAILPHDPEADAALTTT